jgi:HSP20 family protein
VDVVEYIDKLVLEADVAGLDKEDVSVELEGDTLTIRGGKKPASTETDNNARYVYREIKRSSFVRSFAVGEGIDKSKIKVDYQNGAIKIILPRIKIEEQKPQKVKLL